MLIGGLVCLGIALTGAVLLVTDYLFDGAQVFVFPPLLALTLAGLWFGRPLSRRSGAGT